MKLEIGSLFRTELGYKRKTQLGNFLFSKALKQNGNTLLQSYKSATGSQSLSAEKALFH